MSDWAARYPDLFAAVDRYDLGDDIVRCERCQKTHVWESVGTCEACASVEKQQERRESDCDEGRPGVC